MIGLIISGVDETFVPDGSPDLDSKVLDIVLRLRERGMQFVIANGHPWASAESAFKPIKKKIFYVTNNGAYAGCHDRCLYAYTMDRQLAHRIIRKVRMHPELEMAHTGANGDYLDSKSDVLYDWLINDYKFNVIRVRDVLGLEEPCVKISIYKKEGIEVVTRDVHEEFRDQTRMTCADDMWIDCMTRDMNKGGAVCTIQRSLGIRVEETMTFGNQLNGTKTLNQAYYGFAVANAREEVRRVARLQMDSNVQGGVFKILKGLL